MDENIEPEKKGKNPENEPDINKQIETDAIKVDLIMYACFIGFLSCIFWITVGQLTGMYPFVPEGYWIGESFIGTGVVLLVNPPLLYAIYWIGVACLIGGLYRLKWDWYLLVAIAVFGAAIFFAFFIQIYN